jgi:hypothetical protein
MRKFKSKVTKHECQPWRFRVYSERKFLIVYQHSIQFGIKSSPPELLHLIRNASRKEKSQER